jgi:hypothetical protein
MFEIIENLGYGDIAGYAIGYVAAATILIYFFELILEVRAKMKKIK